MVVSYWIERFMSNESTIVESSYDLLHELNSISNELDHSIDKDDLISNDDYGKDNEKSKSKE